MNEISSNRIDTSRYVLKPTYEADTPELENKISDADGLVKKTDYNTKIREIEGKAPGISNLAIKTTLTAVINLVKKQIITLKLQKS